MLLSMKFTHRNICRKQKILLQYIGKCCLPVLPSKWSTSIHHFINKHTCKWHQPKFRILAGIQEKSSKTPDLVFLSQSTKQNDPDCAMKSPTDKVKHSPGLHATSTSVAASSNVIISQLLQDSWKAPKVIILDCKQRKTNARTKACAYQESTNPLHYYALVLR